MTGSGRLSADEWEVRACSHGEAVQFIERVHYAGGAANTSVARHALYRKGDPKVRGVALWMPPTRNAALSVSVDVPEGVLSLSRLCVEDDVPTNGASFLLGRSMKLLDRKRWPVLLTYADTREGHTGAIYLATNWVRLGEVPGSDSWVHAFTGERRGRKRGGRNYSSKEMAELGYVRLTPAPKVKFVHRTGTRP